tara:strand:- start:2051 stop:2353 length:303 start_codon:yes stop_codon:yes gene_type:complete
MSKLVLKDLKWDTLVAYCNQVLVNMINDFAAAEPRSSYNKFLGKYTTSQRDVVKTAVATIKQVNMISQMKYKKDVATFEDDDVALPKITIADGSAEEGGS